MHPVSFPLKTTFPAKLFRTFAANQGKWQMFLTSFNSPNCKQLLILWRTHNENSACGGGATVI